MHKDSRRSRWGTHHCGLTWVIKVVLAFQSLRLLVRGQDPVEAVLAHNSHLPLAVVHLVLAQELHDLGANC